jgi:predicted dehydrogenase
MKSIHIGVGGAGAGWIEQVSASTDWEIAALVDTQVAVLEAAGEQQGLPESRRFTSAEKAFREVEADAAFITCPSPYHKDYFLMACEAGLHVAVEKIMATTLEDGVKMLKAVDTSGTAGLVCQNYRYLPPFVGMRSAVAEGRIGKLDNCLVVWRHGAHQIGSYRASLQDGMLIDGAIHHLDLMRYMLNANAVAVQAYGRQPAYSWSEPNSVVGALVEFEDDVFVEFHANWTSHNNESNWEGNWRIEGDGGALRWDWGWNEIVYSWHERDKGQNEHGARKAERLPLPRSPDSQKRLLDDFTEAIRSGGQPPTSPRDNIYSMALAFAILRACRSRERVLVADLLSEAGL